LNKITTITKNLGGVISKNSPHILTGLGCAGLISTAVLTAKAAPKVLRILEDAETYPDNAKYIRPLSKFDKVKLTWKCYIPAGVVGGATIGCIIGANTVNMKRNAALASLYALSESAFREYKTKVVQEIGASKESKVHDAVAKEHITKNPLPDNIILADTGEVRCYDILSGRYFKSSHETIRRIINDLNYELRSEMRLKLNDFYSAVNSPDLAPNELGNLLGFDIEKGPIEIIYSTQLDPSGKPCLVIDMDVYPYFF
jgi:hypothetical protein